MPAYSSERSGFYQGRRRRPSPENQTSEAAWPRRECPRSGSIGVKDPQSMASPRSRLVTWSYTHLSFYGRRFWRPHPDLDRAATPALPPGGGRPLCGGRLPLLAAAAGCFAQAPQTASRGPSPRNPPRSTAGVGREGRPAFGATGVLLCGWAGSVAAVVLGFHRFSFTVSYGCRSRPSGDKWLVSHAGPLLAEPLMPNSGLWQRQPEARETADAPGTESAARQVPGRW